MSPWCLPSKTPMPQIFMKRDTCSTHREATGDHEILFKMKSNLISPCQVKWLQQQEVKRRVKRQVRGDPQALYFNDPIWSNMWYMVSRVWALLPPGCRQRRVPEMGSVPPAKLNSHDNSKQTHFIWVRNPYFLMLGSTNFLMKIF